MALLEVGSKQCGAFLVNLGQAAGNYSDILLTAAHCLKRCSSPWSECEAKEGAINFGEDDQFQSTTIMEHQCVGVLLNESALTGAGRKDRTRFVLTSRRCIREK
uniref:Peptidase S1 domain-containing protein n=1 Tax=Romanomermis culicivorax TaxID=13658 RepID=A0A915L937_ROMCU